MRFTAKYTSFEWTLLRLNEFTKERFYRDICIQAGIPKKVIFATGGIVDPLYVGLDFGVSGGDRTCYQRPANLVINK